MEFFLKFRRVPQRTLGQSDNLPSATPLALGKDIYSPSASKDTRQNQTERPASSCYDFFAECHILDTRHTLDLPSVYITALGKSRVCRVSLFCRVFNCLHSVKGSFAECSNFGTRQSRRHSANIGFPVVYVITGFNNNHASLSKNNNHNHAHPELCTCKLSHNNSSFQLKDLQMSIIPATIERFLTTTP